MSAGVDYRKGTRIFVSSFEPGPGAGGGVGGFDWFVRAEDAIDDVRQNLAHDPDLRSIYVARAVVLPRDFESGDDVTTWLDDSAEGSGLYSLPTGEDDGTPVREETGEISPEMRRLAGVIQAEVDRCEANAKRSAIATEPTNYAQEAENLAALILAVPEASS